MGVFPSKEDADRTNAKKFLTRALITIVVVFITSKWFSDFIPFTVYEFWESKGTGYEWFITSLPLFVWVISVTFIIEMFFTKTNEGGRQNAKIDILLNGFRISLLAGVFEEIYFRWLVFFSAIAFVKVLNFLFFGFLGFGVLEWFHMTILGPIANFFTLGILKDFLFHPAGWMVGAAMLSANASFRNEHKYLGPMGFVNSWFIGMFFFYLMFTYGLIASIVVHFLYDMLFFITVYLVAVIKR